MQQSSRKDIKSIIITLVVLLSIVCVVFIGFVVRQLRRMRRRKQEPTTDVNLQGFRDKIEEQEAKMQAAFSPNGHMLFPAYGGGGGGFDHSEDFMVSNVDLSEFTID